MAPCAQGARVEGFEYPGGNGAATTDPASTTTSKHITNSSLHTGENIFNDESDSKTENKAMANGRNRPKPKKKSSKSVKDYDKMAKQFRETVKYLTAGQQKEPTVECIICKKRKVNKVLLPCEHACVCEKCIKRHGIGPAAARAKKIADSKIDKAKHKKSFSACPACLADVSQVVDLGKAEGILRSYGPAKMLPKEFTKAWHETANKLRKGNIPTMHKESAVDYWSDIDDVDESKDS